MTTPRRPKVNLAQLHDQGALLLDFHEYLFGKKPQKDEHGRLGHQVAKDILSNPPAAGESPRWWRSRAKSLFVSYCMTALEIRRNDISTALDAETLDTLTCQVVSYLKEFVKADIFIPEIEAPAVDPEPSIEELSERQQRNFIKLADLHSEMNRLFSKRRERRH